jgi:hypothetical protein
MPHSHLLRGRWGWVKRRPESKSLLLIERQFRSRVVSYQSMWCPMHVQISVLRQSVSTLVVKFREPTSDLSVVRIYVLKRQRDTLQRIKLQVKQFQKSYRQVLDVDGPLGLLSAISRSTTRRFVGLEETFKVDLVLLEALDPRSLYAVVATKFLRAKVRREYKNTTLG